jgi:hypothetical protein
VVSSSGDWVCGGDGGCSMMIVDENVSGSGLSWMWMMGLASTATRVRGIANTRGWGFKVLFGKISVLSFFTIGLVMKTTLKMLLTSSPDNTVLGGSAWWIDNVLFLHSSGCVSSYSSKSDCVRASFFCGDEPELGATPTYLSFFFNNVLGRIKCIPDLHRLHFNPGYDITFLSKDTSSR